MLGLKVKLCRSNHVFIYFGRISYETHYPNILNMITIIIFHELHISLQICIVGNWQVENRNLHH